MENKYYVLRKWMMIFRYHLMKKMRLELAFKEWVKFEWVEMNELSLEKGESILHL